MNHKESFLREILKQLPLEYNYTLDQVCNAWVEIVGERVGPNRHHVSKSLNISLTKYRRMIDNGFVKAAKPLHAGRPKKEAKK